jgi:malonyl-CoA O-methyltransferase
MQPSRKNRIVRAFDRAPAYDANALIQRTVADRLAARLQTLDLDLSTPALEIGCGTGFLTASLLDRWPDLSLTVSDIAPAMVDRAKNLIGNRVNVRFAVIDGEKLDLDTEELGLIVSSLAFQWFETPCESIDRLIDTLQPGGWLVFSTLAAGSFREWAGAQRQAGLDELTPDYPGAALFQQIADDHDAAADITQYSLSQRYPDGMAFLRSLKAIGAGARWGRAAPSSPAQLRNAIALFEQQGASISYEIAEIAIQRRK